MTGAAWIGVFVLAVAVAWSLAMAADAAFYIWRGRIGGVPTLAERLVAAMARRPIVPPATPRPPVDCETLADEVARLQRRGGV